MAKAEHAAERRGAATVPWLLSALSVLLFGAVVVTVALTDSIAASRHRLVGLFGLAVLYPVVGALVSRRHPENPIGWLYLTAGVLNGVISLAAAYGEWAIDHEGPLAAEALWVQWWAWPLGLGFVLTFPILLFPDGRLPSARWRWVAWVGAAGFAVVTIPNAIVAWTVRGPWLVDIPGQPHPPAIERIAPAVAGGLLLLVVAAAGSVAALLVRFRRSRGQERLQLKWFVFAGVLVLAAYVLEFTPFSWSVLTELISWTLPLAAGVAILRYRLYDIELIVNRSLVYAGLTVCIAGLYIATVVVLGALLDRPVHLGLSLIGTAVVALAFAPLREWLQRAVDHLLYGYRREPYAVVSRVAERMDEVSTPEAILPSLAQAVAETLRLPHVALDLEGPDGRRRAATIGEGERTGEVFEVRLSHQGRHVGWLSTAATAGDVIAPSDRRLLQDISRQVAVAVQAVVLADELQHSRERLVSALEDERRRLGRDLHDGLGPNLAAARLKLEAARRLAGPSPLADLLAGVKGEMSDAIADIRRLVYELRPPALDQLGLVAALREQAAKLSGSAPHGSNGLLIRISAEGHVEGLPAAVEVAAYRIASEALTNVVKHAGASFCDVTIRRSRGVEVEVIDDGRGIQGDEPAGIGIASMAERAAEVGGRIAIELADNGGTRLRAFLPVPEG